MPISHKLAVAFVLVSTLCFSLLVQAARAGNPHQTIPTAPPDTVEIPTSLPTEITRIPPQPTAVPPQPTGESTSQSSPVVETPLTTPGVILTQTGSPGSGTLPVSTAAHLPSGSPVLPTATFLRATDTPASGGTINCLPGAGATLLFVIGTGWFLKTTRRWFQSLS